MGSIKPLWLIQLMPWLKVSPEPRWRNHSWKSRHFEFIISTLHPALWRVSEAQ